MAALNGGDEPALLATLHFPHYRLAAGKMRVWDQPGAYLGDFLARACADWHHSGWDFRKVIAAGAAKVHLDVQFTRYRADNSVIGRTGQSNPGASFSFSHESMKSNCAAIQSAGTACRPHSSIRLAYSPTSHMWRMGTKRCTASKSTCGNSHIIR